ncbi:MAG: hypothetical protein SF097_24895 [Acidobacteriota bacterium]|nr:hypothetical protein [Acidobacteriota bacterium]
MNFEQAVRKCPAIANAFQPGLRALRPMDKSHITCAKPRRLSGSVDLDSALSSEQPNANRWDYGVGVRCQQTDDKVIWIEVHPASSTGEIKSMLAKLNWLKEWLAENTPELFALSGDYVWVATGAVSFPASSPHRRQLAAAGLQFAGSRYEIQTT